jgi:hypothetical protein
MADIDITQVEADDLIAMEKHRVDDKRFFPRQVKSLQFP